MLEQDTSKGLLKDLDSKAKDLTTWRIIVDQKQDFVASIGQVQACIDLVLSIVKPLAKNMGVHVVVDGNLH